MLQRALSLRDMLDIVKLKEKFTIAEKSGISRRGFASMDEEKQREIASKGGKASGGNFKNNPERASAAGKKGGANSKRPKLKRKKP